MLCCGAVFAEDDLTELQEYLPIAEKLYAGKTDEALQQAEQISSRNPFASALLYLVYSRGYCDRPIDYARTALYFDKFLTGTDAYQGGFHNDEFRDVWRAMRVPPVGEQRSITLKVMNDFGMLTQQKINLKGKYPLKECYSEKMRSIGSLAGYSIWVIFCRRFSELSELAKEARRQAIRLGSIDALYSVMVPPDYHRQGRFWNVGEVNFENIAKASQAGHIPAKIMLAAILLVPGTEFRYAPDESRQLLEEAIQELESYQFTPCQHYEHDLETAKYLLSLLPNKNASTEKLLADIPYGTDVRKTAAYRQEIVKRNDHPMCDVFRVELLPEKERNKAFWEIAEKGNPEAIALLLRGNENGPDSWRALYLAGKYELPEQFNPQPGRSFFFQSLVALHLQRPMISMEQYRTSLQRLAEVYPDAKEEYVRDFGTQEDNCTERFRFEISDPERVKISRDDNSHGNIYILDVQQSNQQNYVDIFIQPGHFAFMCAPQPSPDASRPSNQDLWMQMQYPDGTAKQLNFYEGANGKCPERLRINIEPGKNNFVLKIQL